MEHEHLSVLGSPRPLSARVRARPMSARAPRAAQAVPATLPASEPRAAAGMSRLPSDDTASMGTPLALAFSERDFGEGMLEDAARGMSEYAQRAPAVRVPKLVLAGVPTPKGAQSQREALARQATANRLAVKIALERFGFQDETAETVEQAPEVVFHRYQGSRASPDAPPTPKLHAVKVDKEPTAEEVARELGARLDPVRPSNNPEKFKSGRLAKPATALSVPDELANLSLAALAMENAEKLRDKVACASDVKGIIGMRRPGYDPMLRKYEQRMPKSKALYLAGGRNVVSSYPEDDEASPRRSRRDMFSDAIGAAEEDEEDSKPKLRPALERLAQHKVKGPGRMEATNMPWVLRPELRLQHRPRDFQHDNTTALQRYDRSRRTSEIQQRTAQHFVRVRSAHDRAIVKKEENRIAFLQKEQVRAERLSQAKREHEMQMEREKHQRAWLRQIMVFAAANVMLHVATVNTEHNPSATLHYMKDMHKKDHHRALTRKATHKREVRELKRAREVNRYNTYALIRWFFDTRPLFNGKRCPAIQRWLLRRKYQKQMKHIENAAKVVTHVLVAAGHVKMTLFKISEYKGTVIKCQRMLRKASVRRDRHIFLILSHVKEYTALMILREAILGVSSLFPRDSHFKASHELLLAHHTTINTKLMRNEQLQNLTRIFPGLPLWLAVALEKLSSEIIKVYALEYHVNLQPSKIWDAFMEIVSTAIVSDEDCTELTWNIYHQLHQQCVVAWGDFLRKKELIDSRKAQEELITKALAEISQDAPKYWEEERKRLAASYNIPSPEFPLDMVTPNKVLDAFKEIFAQSLHDQQALAESKPPPSSADNAVGRDEDHDTQRMRERKELLEKRRLELVARVGSQRMLIPAMDSREAQAQDDTSSSQNLHDAMRKEKSIKERVKRQQLFFNVRAHTQKLFRGILIQLSENDQPLHSPLQTMRGAQQLLSMGGRAGGKRMSMSPQRERQDHRRPKDSPTQGTPPNRMKKRSSLVEAT